jgi:hypothetical protein
MKGLFVIGLLVLVLGIASLIIPIPRTEKNGISVGDVSLGVTTQHNEKIHPAISAVMIVGGMVCMAAGRGKAF